MVLSSLEIQRRLMQTKYITSFFIFKNNNSKKPFCKYVCSCYSLLRCFLFHVISARLLFKVYRYPEVSSTAIFLCTLKQVVWKKSVFYFSPYFYLHNKSTMLMLKWRMPKWGFKMKLLYIILVTFSVILLIVDAPPFSK